MSHSKAKTADMETVPCPVCHARETKEYLQCPDRSKMSPGQFFNLVACRRCGLIYLDPRPPEAESSQYYQEEYLPFVSTKESHSLSEWLYKKMRNWNIRWKRKQIEKIYPQKGRILDVGCGTGEFLQEMAREGWDVRGVERDAAAVAFAINQLKLRVFVGSIEKVPAVSETYDVITLWHVLEHLYDPHKVIQQARDLLKKDGLLVIAVPNVESLDAKIYRQNWVALDIPRHLQHFSLKTLRMLCEMHKFTLLRYRDLPLDTLFNTWMSEIGIERQGKSWFRPFRMLRAAIVAKGTLMASLFHNGRTRFRGSTLLTFWRKESEN